MSDKQSKTDWYEITEAARTKLEGPLHWPKNVRAISMDGLSLLGLDEYNNLYWDGQKIETTKLVKLGGIEKLLAIAVAISSIIVAIVEVAKFFQGLPN